MEGSLYRRECQESTRNEGVEDSITTDREYEGLGSSRRGNRRRRMKKLACRNRKGERQGMRAGEGETTG